MLINTIFFLLNYECSQLLTLISKLNQIVIDFTATWCPPCRFIAPVFVDMAKKFLNVVFFKIDVDELQSVAKEFKVEAMPTFLFMREGEIVDRVVGARKEEIHQTLMKHGGVASA